MAKTDRNGNRVNVNDGVQGFHEVARPEVTRDANLGASLLPDTFEMTEGRQRLLSILTNPDFGGQYLAGGEETPEVIAETIDADFPRAGLIEAWHIQQVADSLNEARRDGGEVEMMFDSVNDGEGVVDGFEAGVWLADYQYLSHRLSWHDIAPSDACGESGLAAAIEVAENIEWGFNRAFNTAKRHGLISNDGDKTLDWKNEPQAGPLSPEDALGKADESHVFTSVVRVPMHQVIGVNEDDLTENLAAAQVQGGRAFDLEFKILNLDYENGTCDVKVTNDLTEWAAADN